MMTKKSASLIVNKGNLYETKVLEAEGEYVLDANQILLKVDSFSLTSNNITYAVLGKQMKYWEFFPTEEGYGIIPVWGFADVLISNHPEIKVGQRFYGYYPMASNLLVTVDKVTDVGFVDRTPHRKTLPSVYNFYTNTANDPSYSRETEALIAIFRPLFMTSFLIAHHLVKNNFFGATQVIFTSASSKTAQALAFLLAQRKQENRLDIEILGLTSKNNIAFVQQLGWYDQTKSYDAIEELNADLISVIVDFTGNHGTQYQLQTRLGKKLVYNCLVGLVDWQHLKGEHKLPNKGEVFFAPTHAQQRQQEIGMAQFLMEMGVAWQHFVKSQLNSLVVKQHNGFEELEKLYLALLKGDIDPKFGYMVYL